MLVSEFVENVAVEVVEGISNDNKIESIYKRAKWLLSEYDHVIEDNGFDSNDVTVDIVASRAMVLAGL